MGKGIYINEKELEQLKKLVTNTATNTFISKIVNKGTRKKKAKYSKPNKLVKNYSKKERAEAFREDLIKKQTHSEKLFKAYLKSLEIRYFFQKIFYTEKSFRIVDFYLPECNVVIEIDGKYHNDNKVSDFIRTTELEAYGVQKVYRFTNDETLDSEIITNRLKGIVARHKHRE
jgi:very-short-patch-repair endonuclease